MTIPSRTSTPARNVGPRETTPSGDETLEQRLIFDTGSGLVSGLVGGTVRSVQTRCTLRFQAPPHATLLCLILGLAGLGVGGSTGSWIAVGGIAIVRHGGWSALSRIPREGAVFPAIPDWFDPTEVTVANVLVGLLVLGGITVGAILGLGLWRYLVVKRFGWMSDDEVDAFLRRDPGF